jgi:hypothetical protein
MHYLFLLFCSSKDKRNLSCPMTMVADPEVDVGSKGFDRERKPSDFRPPEVLPVSTLYRAVRCGVFYEVFSSPVGEAVLLALCQQLPLHFQIPFEGEYPHAEQYCRKR